jgi:hypothetical protein
MQGNLRFNGTYEVKGKKWDIFKYETKLETITQYIVFLRKRISQVFTLSWS